MCKYASVFQHIRQINSKGDNVCYVITAVCAALKWLKHLLMQVEIANYLVPHTDIDKISLPHCQNPYIHNSNVKSDP